MNEIRSIFVSAWLAAPPLARGIALLVAGWIAALLVRSIILGVLTLLRFDRFAETVGLGEFLRNGRIGFRPARLLSVLSYRLILLVTFLVASRALDLAAVNAITDSLLAALPAIAAAIFITVIGLVVVGFLGNVIETIARNTALTNVKAVVNTFRYIGYTVILLLASDQLGFGKSLLSSLLLIAFAATALGFAIAFGLGSVEIARKTMEGFLINLGKRGESESEAADPEPKA
jgi:hypothetical protein